MNSEIKEIMFGILSDTDILNQSVCELDKTTLNPEPGSVYDPRLGVSESENGLCVTCGKDVWQCVGHFGHISLAVPVIIFYKHVASMLKIFCFKCSRLLLTKNELLLHGLQGYDRILVYISNSVSFCTRGCSWPHPKIKHDTKNNTITAVFKTKLDVRTVLMQPERIKMIFDKVLDEDVRLLGIDTVAFHPRNLVWTNFPVLPTNCRPRMITPDITSDDDLSITLVDIIKNNQLLRKNPKNEKAKQLLKFKIQTYCDNSKGTAVHTTNQRAITGIKERLTKKDGLVRHNLMGKRCDRTARTVVGGDSTLRLNEVGVPYEIANIITIPVFVTFSNIEEMTKAVNSPGKASVIIKKNGTRLSVSRASVTPGTILNHGDKIIRGNETIIITNCKFVLKEGDIIKRKSLNQTEEKIIPTILPQKRHIKLDVGDKLERYLQNGDYVLLNRQPTLHRNSMQGMKVVLLPGKTFRLNLAITAGYNVDFDGDELNAFAMQHLESKAELKYISNAKYNILSAQSNKPEMVIVQDSLLGAYLMTKSVFEMNRKDFQNCIMRISHDYNYETRLNQIRSLRGETDKYTSHALFGFLFPPTFHYSTTQLEIQYGIVVSGYFDKTSLKGGKNAIIRVLCMEYDEKLTAKFIDNIQFITNAFLECFPFSIGIHDCLIGSSAKKEEIINTSQQFFLEATNVLTTTDIPCIRETRINVALNKAKDIGLRIAKNALKPDNNFISTVTSGSKGDFFNIAQITGLLGQQNINNQRPRFCLSNNTRTMVHYPECIKSDELKYRSRGFVVSSFIDGMYPDEMFFHAMTGREGMTKTAMGTATSGYIQRSIVKLSEDIKIEYDGTVRDAKKNIYQNFYGGHGFDCSKVDIDNKTKEVFPVNFVRLADKLNKGLIDEHIDEPLVFLEEEEIEEIITGCEFKTSDALQNAVNRLNNKQAEFLRKHLSGIKIRQNKIKEFSQYIIKKYNVCRATPGEAVGILCAQSIGEKQTQTTLDTFHTAGKLVFNSVNRLEEILNMNKKLKIKSCVVHFRKQYKSSEELRHAIKSSITAVYFHNVYNKHIINILSTNIEVVFYLNLQVLFTNRLNPFFICNKMLQQAPSVIQNVTISPTSITFILKKCFEIIDDESINNMIKTELDQILISGIVGIERYHLQYQKNEWYVITEGTNLKKLLIHPLVNPRRVYSNDLWEVYNVLGIVGFRRIVLKELKRVINGVNFEHALLLTDKMTCKGKPTSITRYTMRNNDVGPISKATFEESIDILINAAIHTEKEKMQGISASIIAGNRAPIGTGFFGLSVDINKLVANKPKNTSIETSSIYSPPVNWLS